MPRVLDPFRFVLIAVAGWMNQSQQQIGDYLREENRVLLSAVGESRMVRKLDLLSQIGRNLTDTVDGILLGKRSRIHDRDPLFSTEFLSMLAEVDVKSVKLPPRSPNLNAYAERFVRSIKESCLERMILFGEGSLRKGIQEFMTHDHGERNHQGFGNRLILPDERHAGHRGAIRRRERWGGMLNYYYRAAA